MTQFEIVCAVEKISEHYLVPILEQLLEQFPFELQGFHADNGSDSSSPIHKLPSTCNTLININLHQNKAMIYWLQIEVLRGS